MLVSLKMCQVMFVCLFKISPIILNTVVTIMAAIKPKTTEEDSKGAAEVPEDLWQVKPIDECNAWFLGVDVATEATETFKDREHAVKQEKFDIVVKSVQMTLECGLGHRTVPLLLVESVFSGVLKNWSSMMEVSADMSLEVGTIKSLPVYGRCRNVLIVK